MEFQNVPPDCIPDLMKFLRTASIAQNIDSLRSDTLPMMRRIFRSDSTIIWLIDQNNRIADPLEMNVPQRFFPMYRDYYFRKNPFDPVNMQSLKNHLRNIFKKVKVSNRTGLIHKMLSL